MDEQTNTDPDTSDEQEELYEQWRIVADKGQEPFRLDKFLVGRIEHATRSKVQKAIESGKVLVNSKSVQSNYKVSRSMKLWCIPTGRYRAMKSFRKKFR